MFRIVILVTLLTLIVFGSFAHANPDAVVIPNGDFRIKGSGSGLVFPDGSTQYKAAVEGSTGPQGPAGPVGPQGPQGPVAQITLSAMCNAISAANVALPSFCIASPIIGTWFGGNPAVATNFVLMTFLNDGTVMFAQAGDHADDPSGQSGMERGTYNWNQGSGLLTTNIPVDTNGEWGLSHPSGSSYTAAVNGNTMSITDASGTFTPQRLLASTTNPLVGSWKPSDYGTNNHFYLLNFVDDAHFLLIESGSPDGVGPGGFQLGSYSFNQTTKVLTVTSQLVNTIGGTDGMDINAPATVTLSNANTAMSIPGGPTWTLVQTR